MKSFITIISVSVLFSCGSFESETHEYALKVNTPQNFLASNLLSDWLDYHDADQETFREVNLENKKFTFSNLNSSNDYFISFKDFFIYSPDSTYYVDLDSYSLTLEKDSSGQLISYGSEVDTKVMLIDLKNNSEMELMFCGSDCIPEEAKWESQSKVCIAGLKENGEYYPTIWIFDIKNKTIKEYISSAPTDHYPSDYTMDIRLKEIKFL